MTTNIERLLILAAEFPVRQRIDYEKNEDRKFCNEVLLAVKSAVPDLKALAEVQERIWAAAARAPVTSPDPDAAPEASNAPSPEPQTERSNRTQAETPNTDDTAASSGQTPGTADKPLTGLAKLNAARKAAAAARRRPSAPASEGSQSTASAGLPPQQPPATP